MKTQASDSSIILKMLIGCGVVFVSMTFFIFAFFRQRFLDLWFYFVYMTIACTILPLPTPQIVMDYGQRFGPITGAMIAGIGSCISVTIDYMLVILAFRYDRIAKVKTTKIYRYLENLFRKSAFITLFIGSFTPIPFEPIKLMACAIGYNITKYLLSIFLGRTTRYYLLGLLQKQLLIPRLYLYSSIIVIVLIEVLRRLVTKYVQNYKRKKL
ncbi:hypothetical protein GF312_21720 [Candidatus Poribacteria bacterium]|nr:hypothetical protein [Candidatus Poribacteria bacterium]